MQASTDGASARQAAVRFGVGISTAIRWIARARLGETTARIQGRRRTSRLDAHEAFIVGLIEERRDITLNEMMARLSGERSVVIGHSALSAWLCGRGWTFKKRMARPACKGFLSGSSVCANVSGLEVVPRPRWSFRAYRSS